MLLFFQLEFKMAVHFALTKKKICEVNNFCPFLRVKFILMFYQEELASLLSHFPAIQKAKKLKVSSRYEPWPRH